MPAAPTASNRSVASILSDPRTSELRRSVVNRASAIDEKARTVELSFASETPVTQWYGNEILDCSSGSVDLARLNDGGALLLEHDRRSQIGVVERAWVESGKCRALVRFSSSMLAQEIFKDVITGIRRLVSVGYSVKSIVPEECDDEDGDTFRVSSWEPYEISIVSIPADRSVGMGRSQPSAALEPPPVSSRNHMSDTPATAAAPAAATTTVETRERPAAPAVSESSRMSEIRSIGENFKVPQDRIIRALAENESLDAFRKWVVEEHMKATPVAVPPTIGMSRKERRRYSMARAINRLANFQPLDGLEKECSDEAASKQRRAAPAMGFVVPQDLADYSDPEMVAATLRVNPALARSRYGQQLTRALTAGVFNAGGASVATELLGGSMIELLRNKMLLTELGVGTLSGLVGNIAIPRHTGAGTAYWLSEGENVTVSQQTLAQVAATPRKLAAQTAFTKQFLAQSSLDGEAFVRDDLMKVLAIAKDLAGIAGTGGKQPLGILSGPTGGAENQLNTVTFGGAPTWQKILDFESSIQTQNADLGTMSFLSNPTVRAKWKATVKVSGFPVFLCADDNTANGYPVNITNQIGTSTNKVVFGAWSQAMYCDWAGQDVVVDPYTQAAAGNVVVTIALWTDFIVRHWPSFCISTDSGAQ